MLGLEGIWVQETQLVALKIFDGFVFWSRKDDEPQSLSTLLDSDILNLNKIIRHLLYTIIRYVYWVASPILVQFWAPITTKEGQSFLTTRNQPFSLMTLICDRLGIEALCGYRMICMDSKFDIDFDEGKTCEQHLAGRVFKHQFPKSTPNVEFYSITEHPQRHDAVRCGVRESFAFPVFESSTQRCVGIIEVVTPEECLRLLICHSYFSKKGLKCSIGFDHEDMELDEAQNEARTVALDEIENVLKVVCEVYDLPLAQAWVPCKVGWPCRDVTQLSVTEYPLAHYGRKNGLGGCIAICLQSSCTENDDYVLEFFFSVSNETNENPHALLKKILETMRKDFRTLRVASRKELGKELHIEEISIQNGEKLDPFQIPQTTISLPQLEFSQIEVEVMQVDSSYQQLGNTINTGRNVGDTEHNNFAITCTQEKSTVKVSKRKCNKSGGTVKASKRDANNIGVKIKIPVEDILQNSELSLENAAKGLKVSKSTLKHVCRTYGIERWPPRKINKVGCSQLDQSAPCVNSDHLPSTQSSATAVHIESHDKTMQDANNVTIKEKYGEAATAI
ncbi:unnamed protein product [Camellia sinensis]